METTRWNRVKQILNEALDLEPQEQLDYVRQAAGEDKLIYQEVLSLLETDDEEVDFLEDSIGNELNEPDPLIGKNLGPYHLVRHLASGGMGTVYLGERSDKAYKGQVAVKVLKRGMDTAEIVRRFRKERQILANLDHPNIIRMFDGGSTPSGRPYLIMEYIKGTNLINYCQDNALPLEARLRLFLKTCDPVAFAHHNLIVHRDLKPGNILVTDEGEPKLLDFGIAKLLDPTENETRTRVGRSLMTPAYAAPEQILGEAITTACDVYALGVLLHQMLAGRLPEKSSNRGGDSTAEGGLCKPSKVACAVGKGTGIQARLLSGDLDNILLKALHSDPVRRYHSVDDFVVDIDCYLHGYPIHARPETVAYLFSKFFGRHLFGMTTALITLVFMAISFHTLVKDRTEALEQRDQAIVASDATNRLRVRSERVAVFLAGLFTRTEQASATVPELLEKAIRLLETNFRDEPEVRAAIILSLGEVWSDHGLAEQAEPLLREALSILEEKNDGHADVARGHLAHALCASARTHFESGRPEKAAALCRVVLTMNSIPNGASALVILSKIALAAGEEQQAKQHAASALERILALNATFRAEAADLVMELAAAFREGGYTETADAYNQQARRLRE